MSNPPLEIQPSTKVADLLDAYPELEDTLVAMAPPFRKLRSPLLRRSIAKIASLQQAATVGQLDLAAMINALRAAVGQPSIDVAMNTSDESYLGIAPEWFDPACVAVVIDNRELTADQMALTRVLKALVPLGERQVVQLTTTFLPAPGIDAARAKRLCTWSVRESSEHYETYFTKA
jgi:hypothetical protein